MGKNNRQQRRKRKRLAKRFGQKEPYFVPGRLLGQEPKKRRLTCQGKRATEMAG